MSAFKEWWRNYRGAVDVVVGILLVLFALWLGAFRGDWAQATFVLILAIRTADIGTDTLDKRKAELDAELAALRKERP